MKKLLSLLTIFAYEPAFSQNVCNYVFPPDTSGSLTHPNQAIHAIDFDIENNTTVNFSSAEIYVLTIGSTQQVSQGTVYLYKNQNGGPGNLIESHDVVPTSVIYLGSSGGSGLTVTSYKVVVPLPFSPVDSNIGSKVWFGYMLKTPGDQLVVYQWLLHKTDAIGLRTFVNNAWTTSFDYYDTPLTINKTCTTGLLAINDIKDDITNDQLAIYPNPTKGDVFFKYKNMKNLELYDLSGKKLNIKTTDNKMDLSVLPKGIYMIHYTLNDGTFFSKKITKE